MCPSERLTGVEPRASARAGPRRLKPAARTAFSLIELVVVVVIIGIVSAIAMPRYANALAHHRVDAAVRRIVVDLSLAQRRAKISSTSQTVEFEVGANAYRLVGMPHLDRSSEEYAVLLSQEPYQATIVSADFGGDGQIIFDGYGVPDSGGLVIVQVGNYQKQIAVDAETGGASVP